MHQIKLIRMMDSFCDERMYNQPIQRLQDVAHSARRLAETIEKYLTEESTRPPVQIAAVVVSHLMPGVRVRGRWKGGSNFYLGKIVQVNNLQLLIHYDDGDQEWTTAEFVEVV